MAFWNRNKNNIYGKSISDYLIGATLQFMGKGIVDVRNHFSENYTIHEKVEEDGIILLYIQLPNKCVIGISLQNDKVYKINIYLNEKIKEEEGVNLKAFESTHSDDYLFYYRMSKETNMPFIGFESRKY